MTIPTADIETLFWTLREARLPDLVTSEITRAELVRMQLLAPDAQDPAESRYQAIRAALADRFPTDAAWFAAHDALNRIVAIATECYEVPGAIESRVPGFSEEFYRRLWADTAFAMR